MKAKQISNSTVAILKHDSLRKAANALSESNTDFSGLIEDFVEKHGIDYYEKYVALCKKHPNRKQALRVLRNTEITNLVSCDYIDYITLDCLDDYDSDTRESAFIATQTDAQIEYDLNETYYQFVSIVCDLLELAYETYLEAVKDYCQYEKMQVKKMLAYDKALGLHVATKQPA